MNPILRDLYGHQAWADAEIWRAIAVHPAAREDQALRNRLHHIHFVQRAFLWIVSDRRTPFHMTKPEDFASFDDLRSWARTYHDEARSFIATVDEMRLKEHVQIPWTPEGGPQTLTVTEALTQAAMHSHYHRGQNATRLRELGGEPPTTDLIMWYWVGRNEPVWD